MKEEEYRELVDVLGRAIRSHAHPDYDDIIRSHSRCVVASQLLWLCVQAKRQSLVFCSVSLDCARSIFMQEATRYLKTKEAAFRRGRDLVRLN